MSEIKPDVNKKVNQLREMDARDRWRLIGNWLLDHAMIIIILLMVIYIQIQRPAFLATASIVNIIQLTATRLPLHWALRAPSSSPAPTFRLAAWWAWAHSFRPSCCKSRIWPTASWRVWAPGRS